MDFDWIWNYVVTSKEKAENTLFNFEIDTLKSCHRHLELTILKQDRCNLHWIRDF